MGALAEAQLQCIVPSAASGKVVDKILKEEPSASVEKVIKLALKML